MTSIPEISQKIDHLIKKYDTRDPFKLCKELKIKVHYKDLGYALKAFYFYQSRIKNIVINSRSGKIVQRVLCGHELGHSILPVSYTHLRAHETL